MAKRDERHIEVRRRARSGWAKGLALAGLAVALAVPAGADTEVGPVRLSGEVQLGGRSTWLHGDDSAFDRYRDLGSGLFGGWDLLIEDQDLHNYLHITAWNPGYQSQQYTAKGGRYGWWDLQGFYRELPVVYSNNARSLFMRSGPNRLLLGGLQQTISGAGGAAAQSAALQTALASAPHVDLGYHWLNGGGSGEYRVTPDLSLHAGYQIIDKHGTRPFKMAFGSPGGTFIQLPGPINEKIHEVTAGLDWHRDDCTFSFGYTGSIFQNDIDSLYASNPIVGMDSAGAASLGRTSFAPDNQSHQFQLSGSMMLPLGIPNRLSTTFAYELRTQNDEFLPVTVNTAIPTEHLSRGSLEGRVDNILGNVLFTARPMDRLNFKAHYRIYDFENSTPSVFVPEHVVNDAPLSTEEFGSAHGDYQRQNLDAFLSYTLPFGLTPHVGFTWEYWQRSREREVWHLNQYGPEVKLDYRLNAQVRAYLDYTYQARQGADYVTTNWASQTLTQAAANAGAQNGQSFLLRKYTQSNRITQKVDFRGIATPTDTTEFGLSGGYEHNDYDATYLGLKATQNWHAGADMSWQVLPRVSVGAWYTYEQGRWQQAQRFRPFVGGVVPDDPINDWFSLTEDQYHTGGVRLGVEIVPGRLDGEIGYVVQYGLSKTMSNGIPGVFPPGTTDGGAAVDWPTIRNSLNAVTTTLNLHVTENLTIRGQYRFEDYSINDFTDPTDTFLPNSNVNAAGVPGTSRDVWLGGFVNDYRAHILGVSAIVKF